MDYQVLSKMNHVRLLANSDDEYYCMLKELRALEHSYHAVLGTLPMQDQDIILDFVSKCEEMNLKILEIACRNMEFGE